MIFLYTAHPALRPARGAWIFLKRPVKVFRGYDPF